MPIDRDIRNESGPTRRAVAKGLGFTGLAVGVAGCSTYGERSTQDAQGAPTATATGSDARGGSPLASSDEIPVAGGKVFEPAKIVVTQPQKGQFAAFTAVCTHQGCTVSTVRDGTINCPCHGSKFRIADGSVAGGPAPRPLSKVEIVVEENTIRLA